MCADAGARAVQQRLRARLADAQAAGDHGVREALQLVLHERRPLALGRGGRRVILVIPVALIALVMIVIAFVNNRKG